MAAQKRLKGVVVGTRPALSDLLVVDTAGRVPTDHHKYFLIAAVRDYALFQ